tara:strand:+ start:5350 stop:6198 length:849 start_codon:yes stop_codon:yes gene_type:complete
VYREYHLKDKSSKLLDLSRNVVYDKDFSVDYPDELKLYKILSKNYNIDINKIAIGLGSSDVLQRILNYCIDDNVFIIQPTFKLVEAHCKVKNIKYFNIDNPEKTDFKNKVVYISNPNGNTGEIYCNNIIERIINDSSIAIIDEAYIEYSNANSFLNSNLNNIIVLRSLSKSLGIAGLRCGFAYTNNKKVLKYLQENRPQYITTTETVNRVEKLLPYKEEHINRMLETKLYLQNKYEHKESNGNFVLLDKKYENKIKGKFLYKNIDNYLRISLTNIDIMKNWL